jgi:predicted transcriptional regulator of viral defense system
VIQFAKMRFLWHIRHMEHKIYDETANLSPRKVADWLLSRGYVSATTQKIAELLCVEPEKMPRKLTRLQKEGVWLHAAKDLWIPVPSQNRALGSPDTLEVIAEIVKYFEVEYYVGWLMAAAYHGAGNQAAQVYQVAVSKKISPKRTPVSRIEFYERQAVSVIPTTPVKTYSGETKISSVEATMMDIASDVRLSGGIHNAAMVILELFENDDFSAKRFEEIIDLYKITATRRIGYILERYASGGELQRILDVCEKRSVEKFNQISFLTPDESRRGKFCRKWSITINQELELDL